MFKKLEKYPLFQVSDSGEVFSLVHAKPVKSFVNGKILCVNVIEATGTRKVVPLLPLVLESFFEAREYTGLNVHYIDGNPHNLSVDNLYFSSTEGDFTFGKPASLVPMLELPALSTGVFVAVSFDTDTKVYVDKIECLLSSLQSGKTALIRSIDLNGEAGTVDDLLPAVDGKGDLWYVLRTEDYLRLFGESVEPTKYDDAPDDTDVEIL